MSTRSLRVLLVEDTDEDAELLVRELERAGFKVELSRVETEEEMRESLQSSKHDIVLSDYALPTFDAMNALRVLQESGLDLPFIVVSGTIGEETAVAALKAGAHDFVVKGRHARLVPAIEREVREAESRRQRRLTEGQLRASEAKFRRIVETTREGIWSLDRDGRTSYVNQRMAEMLGYRPEEIQGRSLYDFVCDAWQSAAAYQLQESRAGVGNQYELKLRHSGGGEFWVSMSWAPVTSDDGGDIGALAMVTDTTEQRKLRAQVMMTDRLVSVGMLAAGVAHEINNPLAALTANVGLALQDLTRTESEAAALKPAIDGLRDAHESALRLRQIVRDIKLLSAPESEKLSRVDPREVLETTLRIAANELRHRAKVVRSYEKVPAVKANESRLGQVFLNLVVNAAQAIEEGNAEANEVRVATRTDDEGRAVIEVTDSGQGMDSSVIQQLFVPFFTTKPAGFGTGLGLSICHRIVSSLGGQIEVESEPGRGSTFRVVLPPAGAQEAVRPISDRAPARTTATRRGRVMVVDDEVMIVSAAKRTLAEHEVTTALSGEEAIEYIKKGERFDVIICDLMMPEMTGMEVFEEISRLAPEQAEKIVFLTGGAFTPRAREFLEQIPNECLEKPFEPAVLRSNINGRIR
jgi:PAS domain S-box-containing protein